VGHVVVNYLSNRQ